MWSYDKCHISPQEMYNEDMSRVSAHIEGKNGH